MGCFQCVAFNVDNVWCWCSEKEKVKVRLLCRHKLLLFFGGFSLLLILLCSVKELNLSGRSAKNDIMNSILYRVNQGLGGNPKQYTVTDFRFRCFLPRRLKQARCCPISWFSKVSVEDINSRF